MISPRIKELFSKTNLYFVASFVVLTAAILSLLILLKDQTQINAQASALAALSKDYAKEISEQNLTIKDLKDKVELLPDSSEVLKKDNGSVTAITRELDDIFSDFNAKSTFINTTLNFTEVQEELGMKYVEADLSILSSRENFFTFLDYVENTGFVGDKASRLMEIRSINITLNTSSTSQIEEGEEEAEETLNYRITLRIYFKA